MSRGDPTLSLPELKAKPKSVLLLLLKCWSSSAAAHFFLCSWLANQKWQYLLLC